MRGRPVKSDIRQRLVEILAYLKKGYGYEIHKVYCQIFPKCSREVVYYHLRKGVKLGEFEVEQVKEEKGNYSWGPSVMKTYYKVGPKATARKDPAVKEFFDKK